MVEILRSKEQTGPLWWRFSSAIVALYSLIFITMNNPKFRKKFHIPSLFCRTKCVTSGYDVIKCESLPFPEFQFCMFEAGFELSALDVVIQKLGQPCFVMTYRVPLPFHYDMEWALTEAETCYYQWRIQDCPRWESQPLQNFPRLHETERIWTRGCPKFYYVDPPLITSNYSCYK